MSLTIEDGTGLANADSFASVGEAQAFADARGLTLPAATEDIEKLLVKAADFILSLESRFKGYRTTATQRLSFPRTDVTVYGDGGPGLIPIHGGENIRYAGAGYLIASDEIPQMLKEAQIRLAVDANSTDLRPNGAGREVIRKKIGPIETQYAQGGVNSVNPVFNAALDLLEPLLKPRTGLKVTRA